jgi:hypothetical protein
MGEKYKPVIKDFKYMLYVSSLIYECDSLINRGTRIGDLMIPYKQKKKKNKKNKHMREFVNNMNPTGFIYESGTNVRDIEFGIILDHTEKNIVVVFRGSESLLDWYHDLLFLKHPLSNGVKVHKGIYKQLMTDGVYEFIRNEIIFLWNEYPEYRIFITGHSLGAGLATLFSFLFAEWCISDNITINGKIPHIVCISFASPRIGNKIFKNKFETLNNLQHFRCYNSRDIVTGVPLYRYYHTGTRIKCKKDTLTALNDKDKIGSNTRKWNIKEHTRNQYCKRFTQNDLNTEHIFS